MREEFRARREEFRARREEGRGLLAPRSTLLALILLALPSSLLALPSGYISLEKDGHDGLPFNGSDWIATEYCPAAGDRFECDVTVADVRPNATAAVFGTVREGEPERTFAFYVRQGGDDSTTVVYGDTAHGGLFPRDKKVSLSVDPDGASWMWDGGSERLSLMPGFARDGVTPLMIGDANAARREDDSVPAGTGAVMKLHRFRIWRGGLELVHDYVPCSNAVSGVLGVFDLCETAGKNPFRGLNMLSDIPYRTWDRERSSAVECVCSNAFLVLPDTTVLKGGHWYFVKDAVSCGSITVDGAAHLILGAGAKMTSSELSGDAALVIYGQPGGHGEMKVSKSDLKALTVEGGVLSVENLSANSLTVVGGTVTAANVLNGNVTIDGGSVNVKNGQTVFVNKKGQPLRRVTVACSGLEGWVSLEGLEGYGTNDIYPVGDCVYLWLPVGTHRFALSDGQTTFRYCAVVKGRDVTVEPLPPILKIGFFVNGEDVGQRAGDGWTYGTNKVLSLDGQTPFVLSGWATNNEVQVTAMTNGTTVVLSNAFVFATGRPALEAEKSMLLQMTGGESSLGVTNATAAVSVASNAVLTVNLASGADMLKSKIGVFNYGDTNAISGTGTVSVNGGTFLVQADSRAVGAPVRFTVDEAEVMLTGDAPGKLKPVQTYNGERCVLAAPGVTITLKEIPHVTGFTVSNAVETITNVTGDATCRVLAGNDFFVGYTVEQGWFSRSANPLVYTSVTSNVTVDAGTVEILPYLPYRTWDGTRTVDCVCSNYTVVADSTATFVDGQWYAVTGTVNCGTIVVGGAAHLILCDDAKMTVNAITNGALTVYGQPSGCGALEVSGAVATALTVQGGILSAGTLSDELLAVVGGTLAADDVKDCKATINGGSVKVSDNFGQTNFVNRAGQPLHCVTVKLSEEGRAGSEEGRAKRLAVEGLGGYGTNDIYAIDGKVYLWLPDGTHRFTVSDGATTNRYCAVVHGRGVTVEPLGPIGFFVNGEDIGNTGSGTGWNYNKNMKNLTLSEVGLYVLSGVAMNDEVHIHVAGEKAAGATVILSNAVVFVSGQPPALNVDQNISLLMAGGSSFLGATNNVMAISVGPKAALTVGLAPGADETEAIIGVFNYGDVAAIGGAGSVTVRGGTLAVWADTRAAETPINRTADVFCMLAGNDPETAKVVDTYNGELYVLVTAAIAPVTPGKPFGSFTTAEAATNVMKKAVLAPRDDVEAALGSGAARQTYCNMFGFAVTGGDESWFVEALLTPEARTNLAETAAAATRQIPVAAIARLPDASAIAQLPEDVTTNVTVNGCAPGFFYSLYDGWALTNIVADANATNLNVLCGADAKVTFPEVKKPSDAAGFFKVGVGVTDNVGK